MYGRAYFLVRSKWPEIIASIHMTAAVEGFSESLEFRGAPFYEPLRYAVRLKSVVDCISAVPILFAKSIAWRAGMIRQMCSGKRAEGTCRQRGERLPSKRARRLKRERTSNGFDLSFFIRD